MSKNILTIFQKYEIKEERHEDVRRIFPFIIVYYILGLELNGLIKLKLYLFKSKIFKESIFTLEL